MVLRLLSFRVLAMVMLGIVGLFLSRTTFGLSWPFDVDLFRDIGAADSIREGRLFADANYEGELAWYNPLASWLVGGLSYVSGVSPATLITRGGVVFNLLAPVALAILVRKWFGRTASGFTLVAFVFLLCGNYPSWAVVTYSPWMFQASFAQGFFYLALLALPRSVERGRLRDCAVFGALIGVAVLAHTAPGLILVAIAVAAAIWTVMTDQATAAVALRRLLVVGGVALVVASPFLFPLAWRYGFEIRNDLPSTWQWDQLANDQILRFGRDFLLRWPVVFGVPAVLYWWRRERGRITVETVALLTWTAASLAGLVIAAYRTSPLPAAGVIPGIVPSFHFLLYLSAAGCVWFGLGSAAVIRAAVDNKVVHVGHPQASVAAALLMILASLPVWLARDERDPARNASLAIAATFNNFAVSSWISTATDPNDVILFESDETGLYAGALDQRRTVLANPYFSNPFVDLQPRSDAAQHMLSTLAACNLTEFSTVAGQYDVQHVVTKTGGTFEQLPDHCAGVEVVYSDAYATVLHVGPSPTT